MNQMTKVEGGRQLSPSQQFRDQLEKMGDQFVAALPEHIKPERFQRIVMTAVLGDPDLMRADRKSLLEAAMRAAQDGLLPDKREGAFVVFGKKVNWMPMIGGIIKKMHQSGDVALITAKVVYGGDSYRTWVDDDGEHVIYEPAEHPDYDTIRQVFAMAKMKDGTVYVEPVTTRDIEKIRSISRSKDKGPWVQWWEEMAKKSAIRRLAKRLNLSPEIHDLIQRDNAMYDLTQAPDPRPSLQQRFASRQQAAVEADEGFDAAQIAYDGETRSTARTIESSAEDTGVSPSDTDAYDAAPEEDDTSEVISVPSSTDTESADPSSTAGQEGDDASSSPSSPSPISEKDKANLVDCCRKMLAIPLDENLSPAEQRGVLESAKDDWKNVLPASLHDKLKSMFMSTDAVIKGNADRYAAISFFSEMLECEPSEIGGAS